MTTRLVLLGLLRERALHGYEIKHIIEDRMGDWTSIPFGSIYFALSKLTREGLLEEAGTERQGNRPSRRLYRATEAGCAEFLRLLREAWRSLEHRFFDVDIALFFQDALERDEIIRALAARIAGQEEQLAIVREHRDEQLANPHVPRPAEAIFDHSLAHMEAELQWLRRVRDRFAEGRYP